MTPKKTLTSAAMNDEPKLTCSALRVRGAVAMATICSKGTEAALSTSPATGISTMTLR